MNDPLSDALYDVLRATAELSREQALLDQQRDRTTAPRDHAMAKVIEAFGRFQVEAKAIKEPKTITIKLTPER